MNQPVWSQQRVIAAIQDRQQRDLSLRRVWRDDQSLYRAAQRYFGSWQKATLAAEVASLGPNRWNPERVLGEIRAWFREPKDQRTPWSPALARAAHYYFGSWTQAVREAGLVARRSRLWTPERVIDVIQDRHVRGLPVGRPGRAQRALVSAGRHYFGNWKNALTAAGLAHCYPDIAPSRQWSKPLVIDEIRAAHARGTPVSRIWKLDPTLYSAAKRQFGRWEIALQAAGFPSTQRKWSRELVLAEIRDRFRRGLSLSSHLRDNRTLARAAQGHWGSWTRAKAAAGVCLARIHTHCGCRRQKAE